MNIMLDWKDKLKSKGKGDRSLDSVEVLGMLKTKAFPQNSSMESHEFIRT